RSARRRSNSPRTSSSAAASGRLPPNHLPRKLSATPPPLLPARPHRLFEQVRDPLRRRRGGPPLFEERQRQRPRRSRRRPQLPRRREQRRFQLTRFGIEHDQFHQQPPPQLQSGEVGLLVAGALPRGRTVRGQQQQRQVARPDRFGVAHFSGSLGSL